MKQHIYIAGKISNEIQARGYIYCYNKFQAIERSIAREFPDAIIFNPMKFCKTNWSWIRCMILCCFILVFRCRKVYFNWDWPESKGARTENRLARLTRKKIFYVIMDNSDMLYLKPMVRVRNLKKLNIYERDKSRIDGATL